MKICIHCLTSKDEGEFFRCSGARDGLRPECKVCSNIARKAWRKTPEGRASRLREYRKYWKSPRGRKLKLATIKRYKATPKGRAQKLKDERKYYASPAGRAKKLASVRRYRQTEHGRAKCLAINAAREARKKGLCPRGTDMRAIRRIYLRSGSLRAMGFDVQVDHAVPLARGGLHVPKNLRVIFTTDNLRKGKKVRYIPSFVFPVEPWFSPLVLCLCNSESRLGSPPKLCHRNQKQRNAPKVV